MTSSFDTKYFQKFNFDKNQIRRYLDAANHDLNIARKVEFSEVRFTYGYQALIKAGIALIGRFGGVRVRSVPGHHVKILEKMSHILKDPQILALGDLMRVKRNHDFYDGGVPIGKKEADDYLKFVEYVVGLVHKTLLTGGL